jgi:hypothetical protein
MSSGDPHIQAALEAAQKPIRDAAAAAIDPATSALKSLARTASQNERPALNEALAQLAQSRQPLLAAFDKALREAVSEEIAPQGADAAFRDPTDWKAVGLVDEDQFEDRLAFERVGQIISHECEAELREVSAYIGEMLDVGWNDPSRNPLRGNVIGAALYEAIESVVQNGESRRVLVKELGQALAKALPASYRRIGEDFAARGFRQVDLAVRATPSPTGGPGAAGGGVPGASLNAGAAPGFEAMRDLWEKSMMGRMPPGMSADATRAWEASIRSPQGMRFDAGAGPGPGMLEGSAVLLERLMQGAMAGSSWTGAPSPMGSGGTGASDADLMRLLRRLNGGGGPGLGEAGDLALRLPRVDPAPDFSAGTAETERAGAPSLFAGLAATNLIRAHHDELVQASPGQVDHMVIEVVASLFDQILADARVPPQIAREIARLQLPVLRVALRDTSFFSSRKHAVRRFINRISTLAAGFGDLERGPGKELVGRVNALVTEIIEGDFDQVPLYVKKLGELEQFVAATAKAEFERSPAAAALQAKEAEWQLAQSFGGRLQEAYEHLPMPDYLKDFLTQVWSQAIVVAAHGEHADPAREKRYRRAAFHLVASIQPKRTIEQRQEFLSGLRGLTATLDEGLALIGFPKAEHDAFFGKLIADHSGSLKATPGSELDHNMLMRQLDVAARTPLPDADEANAAPTMPAGMEFEPRFSPAEAQRLGLVDEDAVDWTSPDSKAGDDAAAAVAESLVELDLDLATRPAPMDELPPATPEVAAFPTIALTSDAAPAPAIGASTEPEEPTEGLRLRDHLQLGASYQLKLKEQWEKVRLTHLNSSRTFFLFTHGAADRGTISMTARMLGRLCETSRLKAFEDQPLIDRATERVRTQSAIPARPAAPARELSTA